MFNGLMYKDKVDNLKEGGWDQWWQPSVIHKKGRGVWGHATL